MHIGRNYRIKEVLLWTRRYIYIFIAISSVPVIIYELADHTWLSIPWLPIALVGTAVAFLVSFKNNASYDRLWEARKIWGAIVNSSRSWTIMVKDFITNDFTEERATDKELYAIKKRLVHRHVAWLTALRHQLRQPRSWENHGVASDVEYRKNFLIPENMTTLEDDLSPYISEKDKAYILGKGNRASHLISLQSAELKALKTRGLIDTFRHVAMQQILVDFYTHQGQAERIKNFPYPRQYATINSYFIWLFVILVPFGMMQEFQKLGTHLAWLTIPFSTIVSWVFHTMERIGESSENPFEGGPNDIPVTSLSRSIEIDIRQMLDEEGLPPAIEPTKDILM